MFTSIKPCLGHAQRGKRVYENYLSIFIDEVTWAGARARVLKLSARGIQGLSNSLEGASSGSLNGYVNSAKPVHISKISLRDHLVSESRPVHFGVGVASPTFIYTHPRGDV